MRRPKTLAAFTPDEKGKVHSLLAIKVAYMMGRKFEEGDWAEVYCRAKGFPLAGWSNLNIDVMHDLLGVEHKMICYRSNADLREACGQTFMHPAATRSIRIPSTDVDSDVAMQDIFEQYAALIRQRTEKVRAQASSKGEPDMRTGWLLWQESLRQFLYFEEEMLAPDPTDYRAEWHKSGGGSRKQSKNLWIFEKATGKKRYSVTTDAGIKIQPYFDVPPPSDPNLYLFTVIGEFIDAGHVRVWLTEGTARELERLIGTLDTKVLSEAILSATADIGNVEIKENTAVLAGTPLVITREAYDALCYAVGGVNDDHRFQLLTRSLTRKKGLSANNS